MSETVTKPDKTSFMDAHDYAKSHGCFARRTGRALAFYRGEIFDDKAELLGKLPLDEANRVNTTELHKLCK